MTAFLGGFEAVLSVFMLLVLGFILTAKGKINKTVAVFMSWLVINITSPLNIFTSVMESFSPAEIVNIPKYVAIPLMCHILGFGAGYLLVKIFKIERQYAGSLVVMTSLNNTIFMGLPVNLAMFGQASVPFVLYYYMSNMLLFWTIGVNIISGKVEKQKPLEVIRNLIPPPLYGMFAGILLLLIGTYITPVKLPDFMMKTFDCVGSMTTPIAMMYIGFVLADKGLKNIKFDKNIILGLCARFIVGPAISLAVLSFIPMEPIMRNVFTVQSFMPVMATQSIVAERYGADPYFPAVMVSISTLVSLIILPLVKVCL